MKSTFRTQFNIRKDKVKKNGKVPINCRISIDGESSQFSIKLEVDPNIWDVNLGGAKGRTAEAVMVNRVLDHVRTQLINQYHELSKYGDKITAAMLREAFLGFEIESHTLLSYFAEFNDRHEKLIGIDITQSTFNKYDLTYRRLKEFLKVKRRLEDIPMPQIDYDFVMDFHTYLKVDYRMQINSSEKLMRIFKRIMTLAFKNGLIPKDPFVSYKIKKIKKDRGYLTAVELDRIRNYKAESRKLEKVRDLFIFSCNTGLDYSTLASLTVSNIVEDEDGTKTIIVNRVKTRVQSQITLLPEALEILEKYEPLRQGPYVLPVMSNQKYNQYLKEIAKSCSIEKNVTTHLARHTFATTVTYANGVKIDAIQQMLGHTKLATTQIYSRMLDSTVKEEMKKLAMKLSEKNPVTVNK
ncbi:MAG: site-specific integrase [Alistipes sp.]|nr:site-specific integrase [Alistipes sp.]